jgi:hypothetical protein
MSSNKNNKKKLIKILEQPLKNQLKIVHYKNKGDSKKNNLRRFCLKFNLIITNKIK